MNQEIKIIAPTASFSRVVSVAALGWGLCQAGESIDFRNISANLDPSIDELYSNTRKRIAEDTHDRFAHYAIGLTYDTLQAMLDDLVWNVNLTKEILLSIRLGNNNIGSAPEKVRPPKQVTLVSFFNDLELSKDNMWGEHNQTWDGLRGLRNHLAHGSGYIDNQLSRKVEFKFHWFEKMTVERSIDKNPSLPLPKLTEFAISTPKEVHWRHFVTFSGKTKNANTERALALSDLDEILGTICWIARYAFLAFQKKYGKLFGDEE